MSFLVHFEQVLGSYDFFKWNQGVLCTATEGFCISRIPLRCLLVTPLIWTVIFSDMADDFEDMKVLKVLVTQVSNEAPHKIHQMGKVRETYFQIVVLVARMHTYIFLPMVQIACMKVLGDDISTTNAILTTLSIIFVLQVDNCLLTTIIRKDEEDVEILTHESMARRI